MFSFLYTHVLPYFWWLTITGCSWIILFKMAGPMVVYHEKIWGSAVTKAYNEIVDYYNDCTRHCGPLKNNTSNKILESAFEKKKQKAIDKLEQKYLNEEAERKVNRSETMVRNAQDLLSRQERDEAYQKALKQAKKEDSGHRFWSREFGGHVLPHWIRVDAPNGTNDQKTTSSDPFSREAGRS